MTNYNKISTESMVVEEPSNEKEIEIIDDETTIESDDKYEGIVNCALLNVRPTKGTDEEAIVVIEQGTKVEIDPSDSDDEWLHVYLISGIEGYVMGRFITF